MNPNPMKVTVHGTGLGTDALTGKESVDGLTVTFEDGTVKESFLSWKSFRQLLALKTGQPKPAAKPAGNGASVVAPVK
jgi:hypothetical protein